MRFLSLFSGIEAASMAWTPLGWEPAAFSEIEPFPCSVLQHHYPHVPNLGDVTKITRQQVEALGRIDLVCGGFPCQDLSVAGKRKGLMNADGNPTRSGLFFDAMRIAEWTRARWTVLENVHGLFSSNGGRDFAAVVGEMAGCEFDVPPGGWGNAGVAVGPLGLIEWITLDAQYVRVESHPRAVPQRRRRVFLVRDSGNWANRPPLFLERESLRGHPAPRREAWQGVAGTISARTQGGGGLGTDFELGGGLVTHTLRGEGFDASEDGTGRGTPLAPVHIPEVAGTMKACKDSGGWSNSADHAAAGYMVPVGVTIHGTDPTVQKVASLDETAQCLRARTPGNIDNSSTTVVMQPVAFAENTRAEVRLEGGDGTRTGALSTGGGKPGQGIPCVAYGIRTANTSSNGWGIQEEVTHTLDCAQGVAVAFSAKDYGADATCDMAPTLRAMGHAESHANGGGQMAVAYTTKLHNTASNNAGKVFEERSTCLDANSPPPALLTAMQVRRLTPVECERLQGFPDNWTLIPWRKKPASECPDGPRYKSLGNSWAVNCARWIGERIEAVETIVADQAELETA